MKKYFAYEGIFRIYLPAGTRAGDDNKTPLGLAAAKAKIANNATI